MKVYFSDVFNCDRDALEKYGALNVSLVADLPLFIDPFLLFHSKNPEYQQLHERMIRYVAFLKKKATEGTVPDALLKAWYTFREVKQTWLGWSLEGNDGRGLGIKFAHSLHKNLNKVFANFGNEDVRVSAHIEKVCLFNSGVGRDNISDFTTNLIKEYLLEYTQEFTRQYIPRSLRGRFAVAKVTFNYKTEAWESRTFTLPKHDGDYVLLTPEDILTKDDIWINRGDLLRNYDHIVESIPNDQLRAQINNYFKSVLRRKKDDEEPTAKEASNAIAKVLVRFPEVFDYFIQEREKHGSRAVKNSLVKVEKTKGLFIEQISHLIELLESKAFYAIEGDSYEAAFKRVQFLKHTIEDNNGYRFFWIKNQPIERESDLQLIYRLTWFNTRFSVDSEVNNGLGAVDYKISDGSKDSSLVEFKLASNKKLQQNLENQVKVYEKANRTQKSVKAIIYFTASQRKRVERILKEVKLENDESIVLIDARKDNKVSASNVKTKRRPPARKTR
ncbi:MAG: hypothetical protein WAM98_05560 [Terriglobales bacterium]